MAPSRPGRGWRRCRRRPTRCSCRPGRRAACTADRSRQRGRLGRVEDVLDEGRAGADDDDVVGHRIGDLDVAGRQRQAIDVPPAPTACEASPRSTIVIVVPLYVSSLDGDALRGAAEADDGLQRRRQPSAAALVGRVDDDAALQRPAGVVDDEGRVADPADRAGAAAEQAERLVDLVEHVLVGRALTHRASGPDRWSCRSRWLIEVAMAVDGMCLASVEVRFSVGPIGVSAPWVSVDSMTIASSRSCSQPAVHGRAAAPWSSAVDGRRQSRRTGTPRPCSGSVDQSRSGSSAT